LLRFWTLSIVRNSKEHNVLETGSVSILMWEGGLVSLKKRTSPEIGLSSS
jgi:hypothetical protein